MNGSTKLLCLLAALMLFIYLRYYVKSNPLTQILQLSVSALKTHHLLEKLPVTFDEGIVDPHDFVIKAFKFLYVFKKQKDSLPNANWIHNKARFAVVFSHDDSVDIDIVHPSEPSPLVSKSNAEPKTHVVQVKLRAHKCMVVPMNWMYRTNKPHVTSVFELYDIVSAVLSLH